MKKMKKMLALALAFVLAVTILPMVGREEAKAESIPGYYRMWFIKDTVDGSPTYNKRISQWASIGTPAVKDIPNLMPGAISSYISNGDYVDSAGKKLSSFVVPAKKVEGEKETEYKYTNIYRLENKGMTFTAPCDGTVEIYCVPNKISNLTEGEEITVSVNGKAFEEKMVVPKVFEVLEKGEYVKKYEYEKNYVYTWEVSSGVEYTVAASHTSGLIQLNFIPATKSVVSTIGAAYREAGDSWGNGVRFGAELDKKSADFVNKNIVESGTLVARQDAVGVDTELKVGIDKCKKVERTTVWKQTDNVLQYTLVVTNIPEESKDTVLVARPYVKLKDGTYIYGKQISGSWNSVAAEAASEN